MPRLQASQSELCLLFVVLLLLLFQNNAVAHTQA